MFFLSLSFIFYRLFIWLLYPKKLILYGKIMIFNEVIANLIGFIF